MIKYFLAFILFISFTFSYSGNNVKTGDQQWTQYVNQILFSKKWSLTTDLNFRWKNRLEESSQYVLRSSLGYQLNPKFRASLGFANLGFYSNDEINRFEFRPFQQFSYKGNKKKSKVSHRLRIEQRYFRKAEKGKIKNESSFNHRFRYRLSVRIPVFSSEKISFGISDEIFVNAGKENTPTIVDQNRFIVGPGYRWSKSLSFNLYYNALYSSTSVKNEYNYFNIIFLNVNHTLGSQKK